MICAVHVYPRGMEGIWQNHRFEANKVERKDDIGVFGGDLRDITEKGEKGVELLCKEL